MKLYQANFALMPATPYGEAARMAPMPESARQLFRGRMSAVLGFGLPFLLVLYLALREGGYDELARSELGIAVWLVVLLGAVAGILRLPGSRVAWIGLGLFVAFGAWTGLATLWSESAERTAIEAARVATLLGVFTLAICVQRTGTLRRTVFGVAAAITLVAALALTSRFIPDLLPTPSPEDILPSERARLSYPLGYWNGLAALMAMGVPLLLFIAVAARNLLTRALACAALPALALVSFYTLSRGGALETVVGVAVLAVFLPLRLRLVAPMAIAGFAAAVLIRMANSRRELSDGLVDDAASSQGLEMLGTTLVICAAAGLAGYLVQGRLFSGRLRLPQIGYSRSRRLTFIASALVLATLIAGLASGKVGDSWQEFKAPLTPGGDSSRFQSASGSGRYQWWESATDAGWSSPLVGIGPGTFELWWARDDVEITGFVRDAHSLYLETFGELGIVGFALILAGVGGALWIGGRRVRRAGSNEEKGLAAAATAALAVFAAAAAGDWAWELTVLPVTFLLLTAALIGPGRQERPKNNRSTTTLAVLATVSLIVIIPTMLSQIYIEDSQKAARDNHLVTAIQDARKASAVLPFGATAHLQQALVLQAGGEFDAAAAEAVRAVRRESTNWRTWLVLGRIEEDRGNETEARLALERARDLNPRSQLFQDPVAPAE